MDGRPNLERRRPDRAALVIAAGLLVAAGVIFADTASMGTAASYARVGPKVFPYVVAAGLARPYDGAGRGVWCAQVPDPEDAAPRKSAARTAD